MCVSLRATSGYMHISKRVRKAHVKNGGARSRGTRRVCVCVCFCLFCALSVFLRALVSKNSHLKLICLVSVSSVLFLSSCGPWCQKTLILS